MTRLILDDVTPGMVLDEAVKNKNGQVLLGEGAELTEKHIRAMKMWGVMDISVVDDDNGDENSNKDQIDPVLLEKAREAISDRFIHADLSSEIVKVIFNRAAIEYVKQNKRKLNES